MNESKNELIDYVEHLVQQAKAGELSWKMLSPAVFQSERDTRSGKKRMFIQQAVDYDNPLEIEYLFQVESDDAGVELTLNTKIRREFSPVLGKLFDAARSSDDHRVGDVLRNLARL